MVVPVCIPISGCIEVDSVSHLSASGFTSKCMGDFKCTHMYTPTYIYTQHITQTPKTTIHDFYKAYINFVSIIQLFRISIM